MEQIGVSELEKYLNAQMAWVQHYIKTHGIRSTKIPSIHSKMPEQEAAQQALDILTASNPIILIRQSHYQNTSNKPLPNDIHGYTLYQDSYPLIFINTQKTLDEQTKLLFIGVIRLMMSIDGFYSEFFDASPKNRYAEKVYFELRDLVSSQEFLQPIPTDKLHNIQATTGKIFVQFVHQALKKAYISVNEAAELLHQSPRDIIRLFP